MKLMSMPAFDKLMQSMKVAPNTRAILRRGILISPGVFIRICTAVAVIAFGLLSAVGSEVSGRIEFLGVARDNTGVRMLFRSTDPKASGHWYRVGESVLGYLITGYDDDGQAVSLSRGSIRKVVHLNVATILDGVSTRADFEIKLLFGKSGTQVPILAALNYGEVSVFSLPSGKTLEILPTKLPNNELLFVTSLQIPESNNTTKQLGGPRIIARPGQQFSFSVAGEQIAVANP